MWEELLSITIQVRVGGVIVIDNVLWHGRVADPLVKYTLTLPRTSFFNNLKFLSQLLFLVQVNDSKTLSIRNFNRKLMEDDRVSISMVCRQTSLIPSSSSWRKKKKKMKRKIIFIIKFRFRLAMAWRFVGKDSSEDRSRVGL